MGSRNFAQVAPTPATIALNAYIFGYGGHSLVTPHAALKQLWWTDERIEKKVTRAFVVSKLRGEEREFLNKPLAFGEGLTDDTYLEWILEKAKRLFLILAVLGVPDQIFGCIDDSWTDEDLPVSLDNVQSLELSYNNDESLNQKFYDMQFLYLLRELKQGAHIDYGPKEHIPMDYVNTLPPAVSLQTWDRIHFPGQPDDVFMRRKYDLVDRMTGQQYRDTFMRDVRKAKALTHEHIATTWASYTSESSGYTISDFVAEHTLGTFIDHRTPMQFVRVPAAKRPAMLCEWMHCLADALASLHYRAIPHTAIRPSNIWIDKENRIAFADVGALRTFQRGKRLQKTEAYDYAAPESQISNTPARSISVSSPPKSSRGAFSRLRKMSTSTSSSSTPSSGSSSMRSNSVRTTGTSPHTSHSSTVRSSSITTMTSLAPSATTITTASPRSTLNFSRHLPRSQPSSVFPMSAAPSFNSSKMPRPTYVDPDTLRDLPIASPTTSDIYSLGCVFLDILTFLIRGKTTDFVKFRTTRGSSTTVSSSASIASSVSSRSRRGPADTSFHASPDKLSAWIELLEDEASSGSSSGSLASEPRAVAIHQHAVPALLRLVRRMLVQNASLRPSAREVRDRIQEILVGEAGVEGLCCRGRVWESKEIEDEGGLEVECEAEAGPGGGVAGAEERREVRESRDELSVATGMSNVASDAALAGPPTVAVPATGRPIREDDGLGEKAKLGTSWFEDRMSIATQMESQLENGVKTQGRLEGLEERRESTTSSTAGKLSVWRRAILRAS